MNQMKGPEDAPHAFQNAWNNHDMKAFGTLFHQDATFVNRFGHYVRGIEEIVDLHAPIHATIYSDSTLGNELIDEAAVVDTLRFIAGCAKGSAVLFEYVIPLSSLPPIMRIAMEQLTGLRFDHAAIAVRR